MSVTLTRARRRASDTMSVGAHIAELRRRLLVTAVAVAATCSAAFVVYPQILHWLQAPYCHVTTHCSLYVTGPLDGLSLRIHVATYAGLFLASPVILWQVWRFVTPGLRKQEKRYAVPFVAASLVLFAAGASLALVSLPHALAFLGSVGGPTLHQIYDPNKYVGLVMALMAVFGITFEFPVILVAVAAARRGRSTVDPGGGTPMGRRVDRGRRGGDHTERRPLLDARPGAAALCLLRGVDPHGQAARSRARRSGMGAAL